ncbi:MAG: ornithine cyclodeaminase family protein [Geminicoccaceae bacterium]|nr:ornithine cyclodeaminase family protein [Geminicoccaceae bacterium]
MHLPFIAAADLDRLMDHASLMDALEEAHRRPMPGMDRVLMERPDGAGAPPDRFLILPAWQPGDGLGVKLVTVFPRNPAGDGGGLPAIQALYLLFDDATGAPSLMIDGEGLTFWKTSCDSGLAARFLAPKDAGTLLMVGAGALAPWLVRGHLAARPSIGRVLVWNRSQGKADALAASLADGGVAAETVTDLDGAVAEADVISCATAAATPLVKGDLLRPNAHLDLVGGFAPEMREADDAAVRRCRVFVDSRKGAVGVSGDIVQPMRSGALTEDGIAGDLFDLAQGRVKAEGRTGPTFFKNAGGAHLDLMTALYVRERLWSA